MKRKTGGLLVLISMLLAGCSPKTETVTKKQIKDDGVFLFSPSLHLINDDFDGLGV